MYSLPDFIINLKNGKFSNLDNFNSTVKQLPGFKLIFEKIKYINLVETNNYEDIDFIIKV